MGGPEMAPHTPHTLRAPRRSRGTPRTPHTLGAPSGSRGTPRTPPHARGAPAKPWHPSILRQAPSKWGAPEWPPRFFKRRGLRPPRTPPATRSGRPGEAVAPLDTPTGSSRRRSSDEGQRLHVGLAAGEPREVEGGGVHGDGAAVHEHLGHELAGDGAVHEAVAAEAGDDVQSRRAGDGADDPRLIRRHLVEAGVRAHERG